MIVDQLFNNKNKLNESSLADQMMQTIRNAQAQGRLPAGVQPRLRGTPEQERQRTQDMLAQRAQERDQQARQAAMDDARNLMALKNEYKQMKDRYEQLGGSNWQYADREQNLSDSEREARSMEPELNRLRARIHAAEQVITKESRQRKLNEAKLMEDPVYRKFKRVGQYIAERKLSEKEILQIFADAEAGMTDKATGANRTFLGRGKDTAMDFAGGVADALKGVWSGIQSSVPVAAVDVAYDQATDALGNLVGGQKGMVMQAIKKYRMLAKQYPKTAGLAKGALVALTGLATGGAGLPAAAAFIYGLDSAIKGEKLSDIALKAGGAAATAWAGQKIASAFGGDAAGAEAGGMGDPSQLPPFDDAGNLAPGFHINPESGQPFYDGSLAPTPTDLAAGYGPGGAGGDSLAALSDTGAAGFGGGTYTVMPGDQGGFIAQAQGVPFKDLEALNPQITNWNKLPVGTELQLPPSGPNTGSVWQTSSPSPSGGPELLGGPAAGGGGVAQSAQIPGGDNVFSTNAFNREFAALDAEMSGAAGGNLSGVTAQQIYNSPVYQQAYAQEIARYGANPSARAMQAAQQVATLKAKAAMAGAVRESRIIRVIESGIRFKTLPAEKLIDQKSTVLTWALNESVGRKSNTIHLTPLGVVTVFENVERWRSAIMELKGVPGSTRPDYYRPDMSGAPDPTKPPKKQSWFGKGLDYLDKGMKKVGGALSNFGHQFTTNVTKEKLKMNWHQAGKPSDSDALSAWLVKQGVPIGVVNSVYQKMGLPASAEAQPGATADTTADTTAKKGGAQRLMPFNNINPKTGKRWTVDDLEAERNKAPAPIATDTTATNLSGLNFTDADGATDTTPGGTTTTAGGGAGAFGNMAAQLAARPTTSSTGGTTTGVSGVGGGVVRHTASATNPNQPKPAAPATTPASTTPTSTATLPAGGGAGVTAANPFGAMASSLGGGAAPAPGKKHTGGKVAGQVSQTPNAIRQRAARAAKKAAPVAETVQAYKIGKALVKPVKEMLQLVESKDDVKQIKQFIDQTFVRYSAVNESAYAVRNTLIQHVTQVGAQQRRKHARMS